MFYENLLIGKMQFPKDLERKRFYFYLFLDQPTAWNPYNQPQVDPRRIATNDVRRIATNDVRRIQPNNLIGFAQTESVLLPEVGFNAVPREKILYGKSNVTITSFLLQVKLSKFVLSSSRISSKMQSLIRFQCLDIFFRSFKQDLVPRDSRLWILQPEPVHPKSGTSISSGSPATDFVSTTKTTAAARTATTTNTRTKSSTANPD